MLTFKGRGGTFWCSIESWYRLAQLARERGWSPLDVPEPIAPPAAGSGFLDAADQPDSPEWVDSPVFPDSQSGTPRLPPGTVLRISDLDAERLAEALEAALPDIPRFDALAEKTLCHIDLPSTLPVRLLRPGSKVSGYEYFSGANRQALERFISICRAGELTVS